MNFKITCDDPLNILESTKPVVEKANFVFLDDFKIEKTAKEVADRLEQGLDTAEQLLLASAWRFLFLKLNETPS